MVFWSTPPFPLPASAQLSGAPRGHVTHSNWASWLYGWVWQASQMTLLSQNLLTAYFSNGRGFCNLKMLASVIVHSQWFLWANMFDFIPCDRSLFSTDPRGPKEAWGNNCRHAEWAVWALTISLAQQPLLQTKPWLSWHTYSTTWSHNTITYNTHYIHFPSPVVFLLLRNGNFVVTCQLYP